MPFMHLKSSKVKVGIQKAPFLITTIPRCRGGATPFPGLFHFTLDEVPYIAEC